MDIQFVRASALMLLVNLLYAIVALGCGLLAVKLADKHLLKKLDLEEEIKKGNIAAALFGSAMLLFIAVLIGLALR